MIKYGGVFFSRCEKKTRGINAFYGFLSSPGELMTSLGNTRPMLVRVKNLYVELYLLEIFVMRSRIVRRCLHFFDNFPLRYFFISRVELTSGGDINRHFSARYTVR